MRRIFLSLFTVLLLLLAFIAWQGYRYFTHPIAALERPVVLSIAPGTTLNEVSQQLAQSALLDYPKVWKFYAVMTDQAHKIKAGEYEIPVNTSPLKLLELITSGRVIAYQVTFIEGWRFSEMLTRLAQQEKLQHELAGLTEPEIMSRLGNEGEHPEGRFFPDSYQFTAGDTDLSILQRAYQRMQQVLAEEWPQRAVGLPYADSYEALIMASIVEKETSLAEERGAIAGVFVRRLQKGMRLQTDPTVIYGLGSAYQGNLQKKHLRQQTPYNTYRIKGLPPTPIAMPGRDSIRAALQPETGTALYFVARGDGSHVFSDTLSEHQQAVRRYQVLERAADYRSTPPSE